jgi:hypothetical protein
METLGTIERAAIEDTLGRAAARLAGKGLMAEGDRLSERIPEAGIFAMLTLEPARRASIRWERLEGAGEGSHARIFAARADAGAVLSGSGLRWTRLLPPGDPAMPALFDEQVRQLGRDVRRLSVGIEAAWPAAALGGGGNGFCFTDAALCLGTSLDRLLLNAEILEKSAQCLILAESAGGPVHRIPWLVRFIAGRRLSREQRDAALRHGRGERALPSAGY